ncbi:AlpA family transcriptional regulator [Ruegeria sp. HKCCA0370]|uniref:helix-turn-helix transcriptional regulator n=1 Tax=Ruegeria sp. HKCCA0370 TaxID=2682995 RepID=UPI001487614F|nr:helix-turn-helix domain-containing protein [Ruegeria sp. HKCCA0370]
MDSNVTQISVRPRATDVSGAVSYTGMSRATLYAEMKAGNLKCVKIGGATRFEYDELDRWFEVKTNEVAV